MMNKETIKEFLKPDWRKILIFIGSGWILWIIYVSSTAAVLGSANYQFINILGVILNIIPFIFAYFTQSIIHKFPFPIFILIEIIIPLLWYYLLSCLIIFAYDKFRKRKQ